MGEYPVTLFESRELYRTGESLEINNEHLLEVMGKYGFISVGLFHTDHDSDTLQHKHFGLDLFNGSNEAQKKLRKRLDFDISSGMKFYPITTSNASSFFSRETIEQIGDLSSNNNYLLTVIKKIGEDGSIVYGTGLRTTAIGIDTISNIDYIGQNFYRGNERINIFVENILNDGVGLSPEARHAFRNIATHLSLEKYKLTKLNTPDALITSIFSLSAEFEKIATIRQLLNFFSDRYFFSLSSASNLMRNIFLTKGLAVDFNFHNIDCEAYANPQVMLNLIFEPLMNSLKNQAQRVNINLFQDGDYTSVVINDDGEFINKPNISHIMELFFADQREYLVWIGQLSDSEFNYYFNESDAYSDSLRKIAKKANKVDTYITQFRIRTQLDFSDEEKDQEMIKAFVNQLFKGDKITDMESWNDDERKFLQEIFTRNIEIRNTDGNGGFGLPQIRRTIENLEGRLLPPKLIYNRKFSRKSFQLNFKIPTMALYKKIPYYN